MSKKQGKTKMIDVARAVADVAEYDRQAVTVFNDVMHEFSEALGVSVPTADKPNEPPNYSSHRENQPRARARTFASKPCTLCTELRAKDTNFTRVYASRGNTRYCRCAYCGNTWKDSDS
jgi:DNA-directed RNA polymerase subunit M/transcription elongation factor TFIIS